MGTQTGHGRVVMAGLRSGVVVILGCLILQAAAGPSSENERAKRQIGGGFFGGRPPFGRPRPTGRPFGSFVTRPNGRPVTRPNGRPITRPTRRPFPNRPGPFGR